MHATEEVQMFVVESQRSLKVTRNGEIAIIQDHPSHNINKIAQSNLGTGRVATMVATHG